MTSSQPVANGTVYVRSDDNTVYALEAVKGIEQWSFETDREVDSSPAVAESAVYIGSGDTKMYAQTEN